jgi:hypothetical protein
MGSWFSHSDISYQAALTNACTKQSHKDQTGRRYVIKDWSELDSILSSIEFQLLLTEQLGTNSVDFANIHTILIHLAKPNNISDLDNVSTLLFWRHVPIFTIHSEKHKESSNDLLIDLPQFARIISS